MQEKENKKLCPIYQCKLIIYSLKNIQESIRKREQILKKTFSHISVQAHYRFIEKRVNYWLRGKNYWLPLIDLGKKWRCPRNRGAAVIDVKQFPDKENICLFVTNTFLFGQSHTLYYLDPL